MIFESQYHLKDEAIGVPSSIFTEIEINSDSPIILNYWREHCFECAPPICYQSCNNYLERTDGKCRLLKNGISPVKIDDTIHFRVRFRKWAKIESYGAKYSVKYGFYDQIRKINKGIDEISQRLSGALGTLPLRGLSYVTDKTLTALETERCAQGVFYFEFYSNNTQDYNIIFEQKAHRKSFKVFHGWNRLLVPLINVYDAIRYFPENDFPADLIIKHAFSYVPKNWSKLKEIPKLVIWDLDNTLWEGILIEGNVKPRENIIQTIKFLDSIGVVNSIVSKNNHSIAWAELKKLGLDEYFVYAKINWNPKSENIRQILKEINLLEQNVIFVDDNSFERAEVGASFDKMLIVDELAFPDLLKDIQLFNMDLDETARNRRVLYKQEERRAEEFSRDRFLQFEDFLRQCEITLTLNLNVYSWSSEDLNRCQNLMSRTNQLNLSGSKLDEDQFLELYRNKNIIKAFFEVSDKFGSYGIVGFLTLERIQEELIITNLVISCRVAKKGVEHKLILSIFENYSINILKARFVKTGKNTPIIEEMDLMGWKEVDSDTLIVTRDELKPDTGIVNIRYEK